MGSLSVNIAKVKRISPGGLRIQPRENREPDLPKREKIQGPELPFTDMERTYTRMAGKAPLLETLVNTLDLATPETGERPRMVKGEEYPKEAEKAPQEPPQPQIKGRPGRTLKEIALSILEPQNSYTREEVVGRIREGIGVSQERGENGFNKMLEAGELEEVPDLGVYHLRGSTPF